MRNKFVVLAPTRVDLAGGTLDLWPLYCLVGGAKTINLAIDLFAETHVDCKPSPEFLLEVRSQTGITHALRSALPMEKCRLLDPSLRFPVSVLSRYLAGQRELPPLRIEIAWRSNVPMGSGLGGSSTLGVSLLRALSRVFGEYSDMGWQWPMMAALRDAEAQFLETPTGTQDYLAALFGGLSTFQSRVGGIDHFSHRGPAFEGISERILVLFSGEQHHSGRSNWEIYKAAIDKDPETLKGLGQLAELAEGLHGKLVSSSLNWTDIGKTLSSEWKLRRDLFKVSTPRLDALVNRLEKLPILGAKVCGAAAGGSLLVLVDPSHRSQVASQLEAEGIQVLKAKSSPSGVQVNAS
jgi:D-glycero-alpha-D-manno-heptose-7-phosphate kinase